MAQRSTSLALLLSAVLLLGSLSTQAQCARSGGKRSSRKLFRARYQEDVGIPAQRRDAAALLKLKAALNNHPVFDGFIRDDNNEAQKRLPNESWAFTPVAGIPGWLKLPCSDAGWAWIGCDINQRVVSINLEGLELTKVNMAWQADGENPITGTFSWDLLTDLTELTLVRLGYQTIQGNMQGIGRFPSLYNVSITRNQFTGSIPEEVTKCTNLKDLRFDSNKFAGALTPSLAAMTNLAVLNLAENGFSGSFPTWIGNMSNLRRLDLSANAFVGPVPTEWSKLTRLTTLMMQDMVIPGSMPDSFSALVSLNFISLINCQIKSTYPAFLTKLPKLKAVRISGNNFYGPVPPNAITNTTREFFISQNFFNGSLPKSPANADPQLSIRADQNCFNATQTTLYTPRSSANCSQFYTSLYYTPPPVETVEVPAPPSNNSTSIIIACVVSVVVLIALAVLGFFYWRNTRRNNLSKLFTKGLRQATREFSLAEMKAATQSWGTEIGKGGYGTVYKAELKDGTFVAVKRLDQVSKQGDQEFVREVELLSRVHHRHLVNLLGFCAEREERALIYEYMAMGSLYEHLHGDSAKQFPLSWDSRCKIAIHVALGIEYLHYGADPPLIHRDIKSANILLSDDGYSKVADFGLCKEAPVGAAADGSEQLVPTATAVRGSFGYLDPEYVNTSVLSEKSDVYSYGVVLLELITGHKSIHDWQPLAYWAEEYLADREKTPLMVDPALEGNFDVDELYALCDIARTCVQDRAINRPTIRDVAKALVENLGHALSSFTGSQQDSASIGPSSQSDASSMPSTTYTPSSASVDGGGSAEFSYQNYSETLHWTPNASGEMKSKGGSGLTIATGTHGDRLPVPVPRRPDEPKEKGKKEEEEDEDEAVW